METKIVDKWDAYLEYFSDEQKDVYYQESYVKLYESENEKAVCYVCKEGKNVLLFPFLSRTFSHEGVTYKDFETAYGYGGPIYNTTDITFIESALSFFHTYCMEHGYVAGFVRFHPLLQNTIGFETIGRLLPERMTVAIDIDQSVEDIWKNEIHSKNRNVIKKAEKGGLRFYADYEYKYLNEFVRLYDSTMDKLSADEFYYFKDTYYAELVKNIPNGFLGCVFDRDQIISAAIFFYSGPFGHYHLSGSDKNRLALSPNNYMLWEAAKELQQHGVKRFHLGGGTNSDEANSLFQFKKKFSKTAYQFYIGKLVFLQDIYTNICSEWKQRNPDKVSAYGHHLLKYKY